jgi:hypothetical protein
VLVDEEIGYPHELILEALNQSTSTINGRYYYRVKLFAAVVKQILENTNGGITLDNSSDPSLMLLESFIRKSGVKEAILNFRQELGKSINDYSQNPVKASYDKIMGRLKEAILLHIICKESCNCELLSAEEIANYSNCLDFNESEPQAVLSAFQLWTTKKSKGIPYSLVFEFTRLKDKELQDAAIFLSYDLAVDNTAFKRELLLTHYLLVKKVVSDFRSIFGQERLTDQVLESLFKTAIILHYCGYSKSLRLPQQEAVAYAEGILKLPFIEKSFKEAFDEVGSIRVTQIHLKIRLWTLLAIDLVLLILHWIHEIYLPLQYPLFGIQITIPAIPAFLLAAIIVTTITLSYLYRLETSIIKRLRRGNIES